MVKRIINFKKEDWKHIGWLLKTMSSNFIKGDIHGLIEGHYLIKIHLFHNSTRTI